jgi:hypothetical protein
MNEPMGEKTVRKLEEKLKEAIAQVIMKMGQKRLPLLPCDQTMHLMAKAASAVYEAAAANRE